MFQITLFLLFLFKNPVISQNICDYSGCECEFETSYIQCNLTTNQIGFVNTETNSNDAKEEQLTQIDTLVIEFNRTDSQYLPSGWLKNLEIYLLTIRNYSQLNYDFSALKSVKTLSLTNNHFFQFIFETYSIGLKESIEYLILNNNKISKILNLSEFKNLNEIDLSFNRINEIRIDDLVNLDTLILSSNNLTDINFKSSSLTRLALDSNHISSLENLSNFKNLNYLQLSRNTIEIIKNTWLGLSSLNELDLSHNRISAIEESSFINLTNLKLLDLSSNKLERISSDLFKNMYQLEKLYLQFNRLKIFSLNYLKNLFILDASNNRLKQIDYELNDINKLSILRLSNNYLTSVRFIENLPSIQFIYLDNNYLKEIHSDISSLIKMDYSNQNGKLEELSNYVFKKLKNNQILLTLNLSLNENLKFSSKSFCYNRTTEYQRSFLDIYMSYQTVVNLNRCTLKQLSSLFRRVRVFVIDLGDLTANHFICKCDYRLFLSFYNIIIKNKCPRFGSYCYNENFFDDCINQKEFSCL